MLVDTYIDRKIEADLLAKNEDEKAKHISSGKLSASMLGDPLQWQILKILGVEQRELEEYVIRKFLRGKQVEDWVVSQIPDIVATQKFVEYKNCVGYIDCLARTEKWDWKNGIIPIEVKSVANSKFKRIMGQGPDKNHILQAGLYALAEKIEHFAVLYVASDDYRVKVYIYKTEDYRQEIDGIIDRFYKQLASGEVPVFEPNQAWQKSLKYSKFPSWQTLTPEEIKVKLSKLKK
jgi:hypothetical protein